MKLTLTILGMLILSGCSGSPVLLNDPVEVRGSVKRSSGAKVGDVNVTMQPLDAGQLSVLEVNESNRVAGKAIPGRYAYYVTANASKNSAKSLATYPESMLSGNMDRVVTVAAGKEIELVLD